MREISNIHNVKVKSMNVYLEWSSGSDLDIQVMCGCGNWYGYGISEDSGRSFRCATCKMHRDHDIRVGSDGRTGVFEHVYFDEPEKLFGKTIGMCVHNYSQSSNLA